MYHHPAFHWGDERVETTPADERVVFMDGEFLAGPRDGVRRAFPACYRRIEKPTGDMDVEIAFWARGDKYTASASGPLDSLAWAEAELGRAVVTHVNQLFDG